MPIVPPAITLLSEPSAHPSEGALARIQDAIAADLRASLATAPCAGPLTLRLAPGAGALLTPDAARSLLAALAAAGLPDLALPIPPANQPTLPHSAALRFAVASGADILALALHPDAGPASRAVIAELAPDLRRLAAAARHFGNRDSEVTIIGLQDNRIWQYLEDQVACRVRVFADAGPSGQGLPAMLYHDAGFARLLDWLRPLGNAVFLDTRLFWRGRPAPSAADFFYSDLGRPDQIQDAGLRQLTSLAAGADFPVILGGPSIAGAALYALVEAAWRTGPDLDRGYQITWQ
jgi:hypothetical protein